MSKGRPDLVAVDHEFVTVTFRTRRNVRKVRAGPRFAEQLAPDLFAGEHRGDVAILLLLRPVDDEDRAAMTDPYRIDGFGHAGTLQFIFDDELV
jgi:hypothetical protein